MTDLRAQLQEGLGGSYALERELGRGGMATVFLARDLKHDRPVALKVLHPELSMSLGPERFLREIKLAARLQHPHILSVLDSGVAGQRGGGADLLWFTMPYLRANRCATGSGASGSSRSTMRSASRARRRRDCSMLTSTASFTATSSPRTCFSPTTGTRWWPISA
jgi:serine/threonine-protein kinase